MVSCNHAARRSLPANLSAPVWKGELRHWQGVDVLMRPISSGAVAVFQGVYFMTTGIWPLISRRTFEAVTGTKTDFWLTQTVGVLVTGIGSTLILAGQRNQVNRDVRMVAANTAAGLTAIDLVYVARGKISKVYLADAAIEVVLCAWIARGTRQP
jgi:hypothetical protein